MTHRILKTMKI